MGYNFGKYLEHWCNLKKPGRKMPKIFHVNYLNKTTKISLIFKGKLVPKIIPGKILMARIW